MLGGYLSDQYCTFAYQRRFYDAQFQISHCKQFKGVSDCLQSRIDRPDQTYSAKLNKQLLDYWHELPNSQTWRAYLNTVVPKMTNLIDEYKAEFLSARVLGRQVFQLPDERAWNTHVIDAIGDRLLDVGWVLRYQRLHFPSAFHWLAFLTEGGVLIPYRGAVSNKTTLTIGGLAYGKYGTAHANGTLNDVEVRVLALKLGGKKQREIQQILQLRAPDVVAATQNGITKIISVFDR